MSALPRVALVALVVAAVASAGVAGAQTTPTVEPDDATVGAGATTTVEVSLSAAPDGLAGFNLTVEAAGDARVVDAGVDDGFGITTARAEDGTATLEGVDVGENVQSGATDVRLGTVTVRGESAGEADLSVSVRRMDDDDGERMSPATEAGDVTVTADSDDGSDGTADDGDGDDGGSGDADDGDGSPASTPTPAEGTDDGTTETDPTPTAMEDAGSDGDSPGETATDTEADGAGFGAVAAVVGLLAGLAAFRRR